MFRHQVSFLIMLLLPAAENSKKGLYCITNNDRVLILLIGTPQQSRGRQRSSDSFSSTPGASGRQGGGRLSNVNPNLTLGAGLDAGI